MNEQYASSSILDYSNRFNVRYSDGNILNISGGLTYTGNKIYSAALHGSYNSYSFDDISKAWYMPGYTVTLTGKYNISEDIHLNGEVTYEGSRYALVTANNEQKLEGIIDINLMAQYDFTKNISFFGRLHNMAAQNYKKWSGYPSQGFNVLFGGILKF